MKSKAQLYPSAWQQGLALPKQTALERFNEKESLKNFFKKRKITQSAIDRVYGID